MQFLAPYSRRLRPLKCVTMKGVEAGPRTVKRGWLSFFRVAVGDLTKLGVPHLRHKIFHCVIIKSAGHIETCFVRYL